MDNGFFDAYNIRARFSASVILLSPIAIAIFLCFEEIRSLAASSVMLFLFLAFANVVPIIQRRHRKRREEQKEVSDNTDRASKMLSLKDDTFDSVTKERYYRILANLDESFLPLLEPKDNDDCMKLCDSAVLYLRSRTRDNRLVQEENINFGFCRNIVNNRIAGGILSLLCCIAIALSSWLAYGSMCCIPVLNYFAFFADLLIFFFWCFGVVSSDLNDAANNYARALLMALDELNKD